MALLSLPFAVTSAAMQAAGVGLGCIEDPIPRNRASGTATDPLAAFRNVDSQWKIETQGGA